MAFVVAFDVLDAQEIDELLDSEEKPAEEERSILCSACGERVTSARERIELSGSHEHTFTNPHGLRFRIGCFRQAPGCQQLGPGTEEWTWFNGFEWRMALCRTCRAHLGWGYSAAGPTDGPDAGGFYGLILDRLMPGH